METPETIAANKELALKASALLLAREEAEALANAGQPLPEQESFGVAPADFTYEPEEPLVIEGRLPNLVSPEEAEAGAPRNSEYEAQAHLSGAGFPTQAEVDAAVAADPIATEDYAGPMAAPTGEPLPAEEPLQDYGVSAFDPQAPLVTVEPTYEYNPEYDSAPPTIDPMPDTGAPSLPAPAGSRGGVEKRGQEDDPQKRAAREALSRGTGYNRMIQAHKAAAVLAERQGRDMAQSMESFRLNTDQLNKDRIEELKAQDAEAKSKYLEVQSAYAEIGEFKPDRDRWWNSRGTGQKIAAVISMLISGYQHGKSGRGGVAPMMSMMMKVIEDDIRDQVSEYQGKKGAAKDKQSMYGLMVNKFGNSRLAHDATQNAYLELIKGKLETVKLKYAGTDRAIKSEMAIGEIEAKQAGLSAKIYKDQLDVIGKQRDIIRKDEAHELKRRGYLVPLYNKNGKQLEVRSPKVREEVETAISKQTTIKRTIDDMVKKINAYGIGEIFKPSELKADLNTMAALLRGNMRGTILGPGVVDKYERQILKDLAPSGTNLLPPARKGAIYSLRALQREIDLSHQQDLKTKVIGYTPTMSRLQLRPEPKRKGK